MAIPGPPSASLAQEPSPLATSRTPKCPRQSLPGWGSGGAEGAGAQRRRPFPANYSVLAEAVRHGIDLPASRRYHGGPKGGAHEYGLFLGESLLASGLDFSPL